MRSDDPAIVAAGRDSIWFGCGAGFWRYDVKSQSIIQLGPLEGVVEPGAACALAADGRFAVADRRQIIIWTPGKGPHALPSPPGATSVQSIQFDDKDAPWAFTSSDAYRWDGAAWRPAGTAPTHQAIARLGRTWLMFNGALGPRPYGAFFIADDKFADIRPHPAKTSELMRNFIPAGGRLFGVFVRPGQADPAPGQSVLVRITPSEMIQQIEGDAVGVDVEGKVFLKLTVISRTDAGRLCQVETSDGTARLRVAAGNNSDGVKPAPLLVPNVGWEFRPALLRDANGHIWVNNFRWDGRSWKAIAPPWAFGWRPLALALGDRLELDPSTMQWRPAGGDATELANDSYDPKSRTAWISVRKDSGAVLQRVRFGKDAPAVLQSIDLDDAPEISPIQVGDQWWWNSRKNAYRLDADGKVHAYSATMERAGSRRGSDAGAGSQPARHGLVVARRTLLGPIRPRERPLRQGLPLR